MCNRKNFISSVRIKTFILVSILLIKSADCSKIFTKLQPSPKNTIAKNRIFDNCYIYNNYRKKIKYNNFEFSKKSTVLKVIKSSLFVLYIYIHVNEENN